MYKNRHWILLQKQRLPYIVCLSSWNIVGGAPIQLSESLFNPRLVYAFLCAEILLNRYPSLNLATKTSGRWWQTAGRIFFIEMSRQANVSGTAPLMPWKLHPSRSFALPFRYQIQTFVLDSIPFKFHSYSPITCQWCKSGIHVSNVIEFGRPLL